MAFRLVAVVPVVAVSVADSVFPDVAVEDDDDFVLVAADEDKDEFKVGVISPEDSANMVSLSNPVCCNQADRRVLDN